jgi:hypothetical protein
VTPDSDAPGGDRGFAHVAAGGQQHGGGGDGQPGQCGSGRPPEGGRRGGAEPRRAERQLPDQGRAGQPDQAAHDADDRRLDGGEHHELAAGGAACPQQRLFPAPPGRPGAGDGGGQQARQDRARQTEEQEQHLGVRGVLTGRVQGRAEVVADGGSARAARLEVVRRRGDGGERRRRIGGQPMGTAHVDLLGDQVGPGFGERVENLVPARLRKQEHVVGRGDGLCSDGSSDLLEQGIRLGQVHDAVDGDPYWGEAGAADGHGVTGAGVQVRGGLLSEQHSAAGSGQRPQFDGERARVVVGDTEDDPGSGGLRGAGGGAEPRGLREAHRQRAAHPCRGPDGAEHRPGIGAGFHLHLPVHRHTTGRPRGHGGLGDGQEGAERAEQRDCDGDPGGDRGEPGGTFAQQAPHPGPGHGRGPLCEVEFVEVAVEVLVEVVAEVLLGEADSVINRPSRMVH